MRLGQPRRSLRPRRRRRGQPPLCDERPDTIIPGCGASGNDVRYRATANRHAHLFAALDGPQSLAQRPLKFPDTNLAHVTTIAPMWSPRVTTLVTTSVADSRGRRRDYALAAARGVRGRLIDLQEERISERSLHVRELIQVVRGHVESVASVSPSGSDAAGRGRKRDSHQTRLWARSRPFGAGLSYGSGSAERRQAHKLTHQEPWGSAYTDGAEQTRKFDGLGRG